MPGRTAKVFMNGSSQAVRLPADFRFDGEQIGEQLSISGWGLQ